MKIKILVTGGAGFIPSCLIDRLLLNPNYYVVAIDNFLTGHPDKISKSEFDNFEFIEGDCNELSVMEAIFEKHQFDYVFHYAAVVGVKRTTDSPLQVLKDIDGLKAIFDLSAAAKVKRIFFSSSSEVYGEPVEMPQREHTTPLNSKLPYAIVKNLGEAFCRSYQHDCGLDYTIFRFFNTFGPKQSPDFVMSKFINAAMKNEDITIYGDGSQTRTFCYFEDNIDACVKAFESNLHVNDIINVGNDHETSILELAKIIISATNSSSRIVHLPPLKEGDMTKRQPDTTNVRRLLNREFTPLAVGMEKTIHSAVFKKLNGIA
ncbi:MAG: NAD-dependent epimerase/dehydratase family protein [Crocinitomicaceae bacterium]|nr:NAD-dependent epimerase/dehydratase family protein [Crocinitomicaceae bacterium]